LRRLRMATFASLVVIAFLTTVCVADNKAAQNPDIELGTAKPEGKILSEKSEQAPDEPLAADVLSRAQNSFVKLAETSTPAVVNLEVEKRVTGMRLRGPFRGQDPFRDFFERFGIPEQDRVQRGQGSGFIISQDGYIITNNHVVSDANKVKVKLLDKRSFEAEVVGTGPKTDIALLKIKDPKKLPTLSFGDSDELKVGEWVVAIGNPFGLAHTVTAGIVSAKGRVIGAGPYDDFIQTDASINPGNSGGPLLNTKGEVVGINTLINASGQGIGFAIPINLAKDVLEQLKEKGTVVRGWLGVMIQPVSDDIAKALKLPEGRGALVGQVFDESPAQSAGFQAGDVILRFDGRDVAESKDLPLIVAQTAVGEKVRVDIFRDGKPKTLSVLVAKMPGESEELISKTDHEGLGLTVRDVPFDVAEALGIKPGQGVLVVGVKGGTAASDAGLRSGDVILEVDRSAVKNAEDFIKSVKRAAKGEAVLLLVKREDATFFTTIAK